MASDEKYARLLNLGDRWWQFGCYNIGKWAEDYPCIEKTYNHLRKYRNDLPDWPLTVFGPFEDIRRLPEWDVLLEELVEGVRKELREPKNQTFPIMTGIHRALREAHLLSEASDLTTPYYRSFLKSLETNEETAKTVCFAWNMSKIRVASPPGTRKFLQQIQDMVLTHCDPPNPRKRPLLAVQTTHPKLDTRTVMSALNLAQMRHLKRMGNVRACKNWMGEKRDELREYRKHLFRGCKIRGQHSWVPIAAIVLDYDLDVTFDKDTEAHAAHNDPDDGQQTPPRSASPGLRDPFWEDIFQVKTPVDSDASSDSHGGNSNTQDLPPAAPGKNAARNKKKAERRRLRKSAEGVVNSVFHHSGAGTPVGPVEEEATRATSPPVAPAGLTEEQKREAQRAKVKAKRQRRKQRRAAAKHEANPKPKKKATPPPSRASSSPPYSPPPAKTPSPPPAKTPSPPSSPVQAAVAHGPSPTSTPVAASAISASSPVAVLTPATATSPARAAKTPTPPLSPVQAAVAHGPSPTSTPVAAPTVSASSKVVVPTPATAASPEPAAKTRTPPSSPALAAVARDPSPPPNPIPVPAVSTRSPVAATGASPTPPSPSLPTAPAPRPVSPLRDSRLVSPSGAPVPLFWAFDVESLEEDTFVPPPGPDPAD